MNTKILEKLIIGAMLIVVIIFGVYCLKVILTQSECLSHGYKESKVDMFFNPYCIKRVDQTDVVLPLDDIRKK